MCTPLQKALFYLSLKCIENGQFALGCVLGELYFRRYYSLKALFTRH